MSLDRLYARVYHAALRALPRGFRVRHGHELEHVVVERLADAHRAGGAAALWRRRCTELADIARVGISLRASERRQSRMVTDRLNGYPTSSEDGGLPMRAALRSLRRQPAFVTLSAITLALGVGSSTAIFAIVDTVVFRPLSHVDPTRLVMVWRTVPRLAFERAPASYPDYADFRARASTLVELAAYSGAPATLQHEDEPERLAGTRVSGNLFRTLGDVPQLGRAITDDDDRPNAERVVVLSDALWRRRFGADGAILGRTITLNDLPVRVVGVMPSEFEFPNARTQFWVPLRIDAGAAERDANYLLMVGRLARNATIESATAQLRALAARIAVENPGINVGNGLRLESRHEFVTAPVRTTLFLISAAVAVLLAIAFANLTNLQLVRAAARRREWAVRRALGATWARLAREQIAENAWVGVLGAVLGVATAVLLIRLLLSIGPELPRGAAVGVGARAVAFAAVVSFGCALVGGALCLVIGRRRGLVGPLSAGRVIGDGRVYRAQSVLVVAQTALALTLFIGAALLGRSFFQLAGVPRGFEGERVLAAKLSLPRGRYDSRPRVLGFYAELERRLASLPGVEAASGTWALPFSADHATSAIIPAGAPAPAAPPQVATLPVRPGFFRTLGTPLRQGRDFTPADRADAPQVVIVNETLARSFWPGESAIGKQVRSADPDDGDDAATVVGVVADLKRRRLDAGIEPEMYQPHEQAGWSGGDLYVTIRTARDPQTLAPALRRTIAELDPRLPISDLSTLDQMVNASIVAPRFRSALVGGFAGVAGLLALIGIYGVLVFAVSQRRHEIAVRAALGASPGRVLAETMWRGLSVAGLGIAIGVAAAAAVTPRVVSLLFEVEPFDATSYAVGVATLIVVALIGTWVPARRAARVDPMLTLRDE